jgi:hypothetical protein
MIIKMNAENKIMGQEVERDFATNLMKRDLFGFGELRWKTWMIDGDLEGGTLKPMLH